MAKIPPLKPREVVARLLLLGFEEVRQKGSHKQYRHADGRGTTVPFHGGRDIAPPLVRQIAADVGLTADDFIDVSDRSGEPGGVSPRTLVITAKNPGAYATRLA